jgi:hypothetical protein
MVSFPYHRKAKRPNKYQLLFTKNELNQKDLVVIFSGEAERETEVPVQSLIELLETIPKKRERDSTWLRLRRYNARIDATLFQKKNDTFLWVEQLELTTGHSIEKDELFITVNANTFLHTLKLFSWSNTVLIGCLHDRIRVTDRLTNVMEAVLSLPRKTIEREIESL